MAMGIPVLHGVRGESARIMKASNAGLLFTPGSSYELAANLARLADDAPLRVRLGERGVKAAAGYDRKNLANQMLNILEGVIRKPGMNY